MNNREIAFIVCTNNLQYYEECAYYINNLEIPEGYSIDILCIQSADSMAQGYNAAMQSTDAKYKVYLHHDTFIINRRFIFDILNVFESDENIGMLGVVGGSYLPQDAECYSMWNIGTVFANNGIRALEIKLKNEEQCNEEVQAIDGMIMVTQVDVPWREDVVDGWHFYDVAHSIEMKKYGYKIVVPYQKNIWCYHDCGQSKLGEYNKYRLRMIAEYPEYFSETREAEEKWLKEKQIQSLREQQSAYIQKVVKTGAYGQLMDWVYQQESFELFDNTAREITRLIMIYDDEKQAGQMSEWWKLQEWEEITEYYRKLRFALMRVIYAGDKELLNEIDTMRQENRITERALANIFSTV